MNLWISGLIGAAAGAVIAGTVFALLGVSKEPDIMEYLLPPDTPKEVYAPNNGEKYWSVGTYGELFENTFCALSLDFALINMGNCFRTKEDAEAHRSEMIQKMKEVAANAYSGAEKHGA